MCLKTGHTAHVRSQKLVAFQRHDHPVSITRKTDQCKPIEAEPLPPAPSGLPGYLCNEGKTSVRHCGYFRSSIWTTCTASAFTYPT